MFRVTGSMDCSNCFSFCVSRLVSSVSIYIWHASFAFSTLASKRFWKGNCFYTNEGVIKEDELTKAISLTLNCGKVESRSDNVSVFENDNGLTETADPLKENFLQYQR